ncbi:MAG TPA: hypothetical protein VII76_05160 [Acidimicrobiales bacterium]
MAVGLAVVVLLAAGITLIVTSGPSNTASGAPAARRMVRAALTSTIDGGSFHYVSQFTSGGQTQTTDGDAGASSGKQVITIGSDTFTVLVVGSACYFQGDAQQMVAQLGIPVSIASAHAGQWISLSPGDLPYPAVYVAVTTGSALRANIDFAPRLESGTSRRAGYRVLRITGPMTNEVVNGQTHRARGTASLYITTSHPYLPVQYTQNGKIDAVASKLVMTFSKWGEVVAVSAPKGAVSYASLGVGNGTTPTTGPPVLTSQVLRR